MARVNDFKKGDEVLVKKLPRIEYVSIYHLIPPRGSHELPIPAEEGFLLNKEAAKQLQKAGFNIPEFMLEAREPNEQEILDMKTKLGYEYKKMQCPNVIEPACWKPGVVVKLRPKCNRLEVKIENEGGKTLLKPFYCVKKKKQSFTEVEFESVEPARKFEIGNWVRWESQADGKTTDKFGQVVGVIAAGASPFEFPLVASYKLKFTSRSTIRDHESYLVAVNLVGSESKQLYWPRVKHLKPAKELK